MRRARAAAVLVLCLGLAGLVTSVAVAWFCAWAVDLSAAPSIACFLQRPQGNPSPVAEIELHRTQGAGMLAFYSVYAPQSRMVPSFGTTIVRRDEFDCWPWDAARIAPELVKDAPWPNVAMPAGGFGWAVNSAEAYGWPLLCLQWTKLHGRTAPATYRDAWLIPSISARRFGIRSGVDLELPLGPVWSGLAVNTVVYGMFWAAVLMLLRRVRTAVRQRRAARGLCPVCQYPMGGLIPGSACPECGQQSV